MAAAVSTVVAVFMAPVSEAVGSGGPASGEAAFTAEGSVVVTAISIQCEAASSLAAELVHGGDETGAGTTGTGGAGAAIRVVTIIDSLMALSS